MDLQNLYSMTFGKTILIGLTLQVGMWWFASDRLFDHLEFAFPRCGHGVLFNDTTCKCDPIWDSDGCFTSVCKDDNHARYVIGGDGKGAWMCECEGPWMGPRCEHTRRNETTGECVDGWYGDFCLQTCGANTDEICSFWATDPLWKDHRLNAMCADCNGNGQCFFTTELPCLCNPGFYTVSSGEKDDFCTEECPGRVGASSTFCNGNGDCELHGTIASCVCENDWVGDECDIHCPVSTTGKTCDLAGECYLNVALQQAECACIPGRVGDACEFECETPPCQI